MQNPLRSEAAMFHLFVIVALMALPVIVLGLIGGPAWGLLALVVEAGVGLGLLIQARAARRAAADRPRDADEDGLA